MAHPARHHSYAYQDYVTLERDSSVKHEFSRGEIYAMAGGTPEHASLAGAIIRLVGNQLPAGCRVYTSDLRVRVVAADLGTYPDATVICGSTVRASDDPDAVTNPLLLVEVTSKSSEDYDRGEKLAQYKLLPTVREILIVSHRERWFSLHRRGADGNWSAEEVRAGQTAELACIHGRLEVDAVYAAGLEASGLP